MRKVRKVQVEREESNRCCFSFVYQASDGISELWASAKQKLDERSRPGFFDNFPDNYERCSDRKIKGRGVNHSNNSSQTYHITI